jgi:pyruvate,water dikinase
MLIARILKCWAQRLFAPAGAVQAQYRAFKDLLHHDRLGQQHMATLEMIHQDGKKVDFAFIEKTYGALSDEVATVISRLLEMSPRRHHLLLRSFGRIDATIRSLIEAPRADEAPPFVLPLPSVTARHEALAGGKAARLAELAGALGLPVPAGFVVTANAFHHYCSHNQLRPIIAAHLARLDIESTASLEETSAALTALIRQGSVPAPVRKAILDAYRRLQPANEPPCAVCVRSSAVAEDSSLSFAGQYSSVLNVLEDGLMDAYKEVIASKYSPRALYYRIIHGLRDEETPMAVLVVVMVDARRSGVMYTRDPLDRKTDAITIYVVAGLGERLVSGRAAADVIRVARAAGKAAAPAEPQTAPATTVALDEASAARLAAWGEFLEETFQHPQDVEWCQDARGGLFLLQSRPLQMDLSSEAGATCPLVPASTPVRLAAGERAARGAAAGRVFKALRSSDVDRVPPGSVLVAPTTSPDFVKVMDRLSAVVTDVGSSAGHFASIAREFGIPVLVNTGTATRVLEDGETVTVDADGARVFAGVVEELLAASAAPRQAAAETPCATVLRAVLGHISPLTLLDPESPAFAPERCRSLHDVLRYAHEMAVRGMFFLGGRGGARLKGARKLQSDIPILLYLVDLGEGIRSEAMSAPAAQPQDVLNAPFQFIWRGLSHPDIQWSQEILHFNWEAFDRMSAGIVSLESPLLASYAILSRDYLNLSVHFGYHFVVVDTLCGPVSDENYIFLHFKGGGGAPENRRLRVLFLAKILAGYDFNLHQMGDVLDAHLRRAPGDVIGERLEMIGRLLGCTRLLDMVLQDEAGVDSLVGEFLRGNYRLGPPGLEQVRIQRRYSHRQV